MHALADVPPRVLDRRVAIDVGQLSQAEAIVVVARISKAVDYHAVRLAVKDLADAAVELVVGYRGPIGWLLVTDRRDFRPRRRRVHGRATAAGSTGAVVGCRVVRICVVHRGVGRW